MNSIDFTLGVFLTKGEYDLLDWMVNCDSKGKPYERKEYPSFTLYVPLDNLSDAQTLLLKYLKNTNLETDYYKKMFKDNPLGLNKIDVILMLNRVIFKVFYNMPLNMCVVNMDKDYRVSGGWTDKVKDMVLIRFQEDDHYTKICGKVEYNDRVQEIFDIRWGGLLLRNVSYDDIIVTAISDIGDGVGTFSLVNKIMRYREGKLSYGQINWIDENLFMPVMGVEHINVTVNIPGGGGDVVNINEAGDFFNDNEGVEIEVDDPMMF